MCTKLRIEQNYTYKVNQFRGCVRDIILHPNTHLLSSSPQGFFFFRPAETLVSATKWLQLIVGPSFAVILAHTKEKKKERKRKKITTLPWVG